MVPVSIGRLDASAQRCVHWTQWRDSVQRQKELRRCHNYQRDGGFFHIPRKVLMLIGMGICVKMETWKETESVKLEKE